MILVTLAHALLTVLVATSRRSHPQRAPTTTGEPDDELIPLTVPEIRRLLNAWLIQPARDLIDRLHWSRWRRRAQACPKRCHYQRQRARDG